MLEALLCAAVLAALLAGCTRHRAVPSAAPSEDAEACAVEARQRAAEWVGIALAAGLGGEDEARARYQKILRDGCELDKVLPAPAPADGPPVGHGLGRALSPDGGAQ